MEPRLCRAGAAAVFAGLGTAGAVAAAGPGDLPAPQEGPDEARRRAEEILARPEFVPEPRSLIEIVLDEIGKLLGKVVGGIGAGSEVVAWLVVAALGGLLAFGLWRAVRALQTDPGSRGGVEVDGRIRPAADWRAEAAAHEAAGRWRDALRCTWRATVAELASRGLVEEVPGRTTGEYQAGVARSLPDGATAFSQATRLFEDAWYAAVEVHEADAARARELGDRVLAAARR